jgi:hypothetical protein
MQYKTLVLQLLRKQFPTLHGRLKQSRSLLQALNLYSTRLKMNHEIWIHSLAERKPSSDPSQIKSEALELALQEVQERLSALSRGDEALSLDAAMGFLKAQNPSE